MNRDSSAQRAEQLKNEGFVRLQNGELEQASHLLEQVVSLVPSDAATQNLLGNLYSHLCNHQKAKAAFSRYLDLIQTNPQGYINRGAVNLKLNLFSDAIADYRQAVHLSPGNTNVLIWLANAYDTAGKSDHAMQTYQEAIDTDPDNPMVYYERGLAFEKQDRFTEALKDFEQVLLLNPQDENALIMKRKMLIARHNFDPNDSTMRLDQAKSLRLSEEGDRLADAGDLTGAIRSYSEAIRENPSNAILWGNRGWIYSRNNELHSALTDLSHAISIEPNLIQAYTNRGQVLTLLNRLEEALQDYEQIARIDDHNAWNYYNMGSVLKEMKRYKEALVPFTHAIRLDGNDSDYYIGRGFCYEQLKKPTEALADFTHAVRINPGQAYSYFNRGNILYDLRRYETALRDFETSLSLNPGFFMAHINKAAALEKLERSDEAFEELLEAVRLREDYPFTHIKLGYHYIRKQDAVRAGYHFKRAGELGHPDSYTGLREVEAMKELH